MTDVVDRATRSRMMSGIRGKNTKPELSLRRALHRLGLRFRVHAAELPGRPDIVFPKLQAVVQVHGCFWHRHTGCRFATTPASRTDFWRTKFVATMERDRKTELALRTLGWRTAVIWECELRSLGEDVIAAALLNWLEQGAEDFHV
jgi:DNA mismatch endonuclease (patch repair protein)